MRFKCVPHSMFASRGATTKPNELVIAIQPEENVTLELMAKTPGLDRDGVRLREVPLDIGLAGAFSFFSNKNLAVGEGGMVVTDDDQVAARMRLLRSHGMTALSWDQARGHAFGYDVVALGFNYRLDEPRAALGTTRLARLDADNARRAARDARHDRRRAAGAADPLDAGGPAPPRGRRQL